MTDRSVGGDRLAGPLEADVLLPMQFFPPFRQGTLERERLLMLAVLQDAVECYQRYAHARSERGREEFEEANAWFNSQDRSWLFSFESICDTLEIDADCLRRGLSDWRERQQGAGSSSPAASPIEVGVRHVAPRRRGGQRSGTRWPRGRRVRWPTSRRANSG
jgi:hypothetical protein